MASSRPRPQVIRLTDAAAERIKYVMANATKAIIGVRVGVKNGGCAGMAYTMEYAEAANPADEVVEDKGVRILIDPKAVLFLLGTEMDYKVDIADDRKVTVDMTLTTPNCPSAAELPAMVENAVASVPGVGEVAVNVVWEPPWDQSRMSDEARVALNMW